MLGRQVALAAVVLLASACAMPKTPVYKPDTGMGREFCEELAQRAQVNSTQEMGVGVTLLVLAGASVTAAGVMSTINGQQEEPNEILGYVGGGLAVLPLVGVPAGMVLLSRADEASALSASANTALALSDTDQEAYRDCALAKAAWVGSRTDATALAREALAEEKESKDDEKTDDGEEPPPAEPEPAESTDEADEPTPEAESAQ